MSELAYSDDNIVHNTPGLNHNRVLSRLDRTGLPAWLLAFGFFLGMSLTAFIVLILVSAPDPAYYRNSVAFSAIVSFFFLFYFSMGRGWYEDLIVLLGFEPSLERYVSLLLPSSAVIWLELAVAIVSAAVNLVLSPPPVSFYANIEFWLSLYVFLVLQYMMIIFVIDLVFRQLYCLTSIADNVRIDLWETELYSTLANPMFRFFRLYIFGLCVIAMSFMVFTEGETGAADMFVIMMPWYVPGFIFMSVYLVPYNRFRKRVHVVKQLELNRVAEALRGNTRLMRDSPLAADADALRLIDLLAYQDRIRQVREWPFTDRIRALVLFGILPPLTWVIAAFIEIIIESNL